MDRWPDLHDATLESLELHWSSGEAVMRIRTGDAAHPQRVIVASGVLRLRCDRQLPWGASASINVVRGPTAAGDGASVLEIEMQSGDVILIETGAFTLQDAK
ncbi:MAG: hypothetical protein HYV09_37730 [Deltaproteobacteria bacterium]|nr:hypothetical protein [Deltaproteobacteria bacterium]